MKNPETEEVTIGRMTEAILDVFQEEERLKEYQKKSYEIAHQFLNTEVEQSWIKLMKNE